MSTPPRHCCGWTGTQFETVDRANAAKAAGLDPEKVQIHTTLLGGGFGRRANPVSDFVVEAVYVAKAAKAPVKVMWTREDDLKGGWYRPMWHDRFSAGLDANGEPVAWTHTIVGQSIMMGTLFEAVTIKDGVDSSSVEGAADIIYGFPNLQVDLHSPEIGVPVQWWRSVGHSHTGFSVEAFFDEVAHAAGKDPYELRRKLLVNQPRMLAVLDLAAKKANWGVKLAPGVGQGIAVHFSFDSYVAQVIEASAEKNGTVRVHRVVCAVDCGTVINPDTVKAQMEGGIIFGLTAALKTEIVEFTKALKLNPNGARSYLGRAWARYDACELDQVASDFEKAVAQDPSARKEIYNAQRIQNRRQECAILAEQAQREALMPVQRPSSPNLGQWYEREQAAGRANAADAAGNHEAARVIRESMP